MSSQAQNQEHMLKESIKHFLKLYHNGSSNFSSFENIFFRLIQTMLDPPLEITWFYSAVTFHASKSSSQKNDPSTRVLIAKDLLNLLISCSNLSSAPKKIVLLAPVVYELYNILYDFRNDRSCVKNEVEKLLNSITSHIMMSGGVSDCGNRVVEFDSSTIACFQDLVRVWTADRAEEGSYNFREKLMEFFPVVSDREMNSRRGVQDLVGIVLCEVFLLRLCLSFGSGLGAEESMKNTQYLAVQTIEAVRNCYFLDMLFKMLLEPSLPVTALLSCEDAVLLQKALYGAVMLVDYSFYSERWVLPAGSHPKRLPLLWVLVVDSAIQFAGSTNDQAAVTAYLNAFCESRLVSELIKWASTQAGIEERNTWPCDCTPKSFIKRLFVLEDQGIKVFDKMLRAEAKSRVECNSPNPKLDLKGLNDQEMSDGKIEGCRKRKEALCYDVQLQEPQFKHVKLDDSLGNSTRGKCFAFSSGNEVQRFESEDDMEIV